MEAVTVVGVVDADQARKLQSTQHSSEDISLQEFVWIFAVGQWRDEGEDWIGKKVGIPD